MTPRRIVVGFDSEAPATVAAVAARLARLLEAELAGVFVEAPDALRMAALPFAVVVERSGRAIPIGPADLAALLRSAASTAERALRGEARRENLNASFRVTRGPFLGELEQAATARDLIVVDSSGHSRRQPTSGPVAAVIDAPEHAAELLDLAAAVAGPGEPVVGVVARAGTARDAVERWVVSRGRKVLLVSVDRVDAAGVVKALAPLPGRLLIVGQTAPWLGEGGIRHLRRELGCPLLIAR
jgi:hypothetical protein